MDHEVPRKKKSLVAAPISLEHWAELPILSAGEANEFPENFPAGIETIVGIWVPELPWKEER